MPLLCARCSRANPADAQYCYFDGVALSGASAARATPVGLKAFTAPFTLPSGKQCQNFDQLAIGCQENWAGAVEALKQGYLEKFMVGQGRADLALAAREAARYPNHDRGLDQFLGKLPSQALKEPKLVVEPADLNLGKLQIGASKSTALQLRNQGMRLIYGSVSIQNAPWLSLGTGASQKLFQFGSELSIPVTLQGKRLRASNKPLEGKLLVDTNAGMHTIAVRAEVPVKPFPSGCLAGARSPRQVAEKAKAHPKEAGPLFENGGVARWYRENGWTYPVKGAAASGLGAVQQFFEALGLTPPPRVEVNQETVKLQGQPGQQLRHTLEIKAHEKRPIYAHGAANQPWLEVGRARLNGRVATIPITVANVPSREGETLSAKVTITANGNQRFVIPVTLTIDGRFNVLAPIAAGGEGPVIRDTRPRNKNGRGISLVPLLLLLLCLFGVLTFDIFSGKAGAGFGWGPGTDPPPEIPGPYGPGPYDRENRLAVLFTEEMQKFGIAVLQLRDPRYPEKPKLLTRTERGHHNNTVVRIDGADYVFGFESAGAGIRWKVLNGRVQKEIKSANGRKWTSTMRWETERIEVTQIVEIVVGQHTRLYDTVLVTYEIYNADDKTHYVGLRAMIDTYIGLNDGTPFFLPPTEDDPSPKLVDTKIELEKARIPAFMRVIENNNLTDPNTTVAELGLKIRKYEELNKLVVCRWPQEWGASQARWDWPYQAMNEPAGKEKDSCVVLYWSRLNMNAKEKRTMGYTYGLGRIAEKPGPGFTDESKGKIALKLFPAVRGKPFATAAYVKSADGQNCTLKLPGGIRFVKGENPAKVVRTEPGKDYAVVTWQVIADEPGEYTLEATLDDGARSTEKATVPPGSIFGG